MLNIFGIGQFLWSQIVFSVIERFWVIGLLTGASLALINLSLRFGHLLWANIGHSRKSTDPFSLVWAISHLFRIDPIIGGFIGLNVRIKGTLSEFNFGIFGAKKAFSVKKLSPGLLRLYSCRRLATFGIIGGHFD